MREGLTGERVLCRVYLRSTDLVHGQTAAGWIVGQARKAGLAGATVLEGMYGYGSRGVVAPRLWHMSVERPVIVEVVEEGERIVEFLEEGVLPWLRHGMVTLERAAVLLYRDREGEGVELKGAGSVKDLSTVPTCAGRLPMVRDGVLLRIFAGESDEVGGRPLYEAVVSKARELGMSGATVLRGSMGYGKHTVVHTTQLLEQSRSLPVVIEVVDREEKVGELLPYVEEMVKEGLITMEGVRIVGR